jgi:hypothetical protein
MNKLTSFLFEQLLVLLKPTEGEFPHGQPRTSFGPFLVSIVQIP